jgi:homoserine kinase type II
VGEALAKIHLAGVDFHLSQANLRSIDWWKSTIPLVTPHLNKTQDQLIQSELATQIDYRYSRIAILSRGMD